MNVIKRKNSAGDKYFYYLDYGRGAGGRATTGIFTFVKPKDQIQKDFNKEALKLLETKKCERIIEEQAVGSSFIPKHRFKSNFIDYFAEFVELNKRKGNRHLKNCFTQFKLFIDKDFISPGEVTENFCKRFKKWLLEKYTGSTPADYYSRLKWVLNAAHADGYFQKNPTAQIFAKSNPSIRIKQNLEVEEYLQLLKTPCLHEEVKAAFIFSLYTGLRWCDTKQLEWKDIRAGLLTTRIIQAKTGQPVTITLHPIVKSILEHQGVKAGVKPGLPRLVFTLPSADGANKLLGQWVRSAGIQKKISWSCARLSFSILLQDQLVDDASVAALLGHTSTDQVRRTYKRMRPKNAIEAIGQLPAPKEIPFFFK